MEKILEKQDKNSENVVLNVKLEIDSNDALNETSTECVLELENVDMKNNDIAECIYEEEGTDIKVETLQICEKCTSLQEELLKVNDSDNILKEQNKTLNDEYKAQLEQNSINYCYLIKIELLQTKFDKLKQLVLKNKLEMKKSDEKQKLDVYFRI